MTSWLGVGTRMSLHTALYSGIIVLLLFLKDLNKHKGHCQLLV